MKRILIVFFVSAILPCLLLANESPTKVVEKYLGYMQYKQYDKMYELHTIQNKQAVPKEQFISECEENDVISLQSFKINSEEIESDSAIVKYQMTYTILVIGTTETIYQVMYLYLQDGQWRINY